MGPSAFNVSGDRQNTSSWDKQDLGAFAALCLAGRKTPFFCRDDATLYERLVDIYVPWLVQVFN